MKSDVHWSRVRAAAGGRVSNRQFQLWGKLFVQGKPYYYEYRTGRCQFEAPTDAESLTGLPSLKKI